MWYNWKDVRDVALLGLVAGIVLVVLALGSAYMIADANDHDVATFSVLAKVSLWGYGGLFGLLCQIAFWGSGITVWTHGWAAKTCSVVGANLAYVTPFAVALWLV